MQQASTFILFKIRPIYENSCHDTHTYRYY
jgi:hypothetical protein